MDLDARARELVSRWEHGDQQHREWLREVAVPDIRAALQAVRDDALREAADAVDTGRMRDNPADAIRALIAAPDAKEPPGPGMARGCCGFHE